MNNSTIEQGSVPDEVVMYGSDWCGYTQRAQRWLKAWNVAHRYVDVDANPEAEQQIADWNAGRAIRPTFQIGDLVLVNPDEGVLKHELRSRGLLAE